MTSVKLVLEYDGTGFAGWAVQPRLRTVEGALSRAIETVLGGPFDISVAGRTDAGVHAWGQVASFDAGKEATEPEGLLRSLNGLLPADVAVTSVDLADDGFDARRDARSRTYCYRVLARAAPSPFERKRALWWPRRVDDESLQVCAAALVGSRDFTAFTPTQTDHVRFERDVARSEWRRSGQLVEFWIEADTFMRHMVRTLVGTMLEVAAGRLTAERFASLLDGAPRSSAGPTAEPHGLYLASARY